jgi:polyhydroxybutyrate depolymerase
MTFPGRLTLALAVTAGSLCACTSDGAGGADGGGRIFGGSRPVELHVPPGYDPARPAPLVILLHGYGVDGAREDAGVTHLAEEADRAGYLFAAPDGTVDGIGNRFWNATDACCNYFGSTVDDVAYLRGLVAEIGHRFSVDSSRVCFAGHSNGGFMAHRMACDAADVVTGVVSFAGATWKDPNRCHPAAPVSVLEMQGDADRIELYGGGPGSGVPGDGPYPGAVETAEDWAILDGCVRPGTTQVGALDLIGALAGNETDVLAYPGCKSGTRVELWTLRGAGHLADFGDQFGHEVWERFLSTVARR